MHRVLVRCVLITCTLTLVAGCGLQRDWGDDHLVLDELQLLEDNELWVELWGFGTQPAGCDLATCQNVIGGTSYEITGDVDQAKAAALDELMQRWVLTSDADPYRAETSEFQLRDDVDINTSTGTAFLTVHFQNAVDLLEDEPVPHAIVFRFTSDIDPNWMNDRVLTRNNVLSPGGLALMCATLCVAAWAARWR